MPQCPKCQRPLSPHYDYRQGFKLVAWKCYHDCMGRTVKVVEKPKEHKITN